MKVGTYKVRSFQFYSRVVEAAFLNDLISMNLPASVVYISAWRSYLPQWMEHFSHVNPSLSESSHLITLISLEFTYSGKSHLQREMFVYKSCSLSLSITG